MYQKMCVSLLGGFLLASVFAPAAMAAPPPEAIRNYNQGIEAYGQGRSAEALKRFQRAVAIEPNYADAYYNMGSIHYQMKQYEMARQMFERAVSLSPVDSQAKYNLALSLEKLKRYQDAVNVLQQIPANDPKAAQAKSKIDELKPALKPALQPQAAATAPAAQSPTKPLVSPAAPAEKPAGKALVQPFSKGYDGPTGIVIGPGGFMYVANYSKNVIYRVGANGDKTVFYQGDQVKGPIGLAYNAKLNELYVANYLLNNIARINAAGKASVLAGGLNKPYNLFMDTVNDVLYVSEQDPANVISRVILN